MSSLSPQIARTIEVLRARTLGRVPRRVHCIHDILRKRLLELQRVRQVLMMKARRIGGSLNVESVVDDADEIVG